MSTATEEISPRIWKKLPFELKEEIIDHYIEDILAEGVDVNEDDIHSDTCPRLLDPWLKYRHSPVFSNRQKGRIERHYRDHWLRRTTLYLFLGGRDQLYCRYLTCPEGKDIDTTLPEVGVKQVEDEGEEGKEGKEGRNDDDHGGSGHSKATAAADEKVTFFLRGPLRSARQGIYGSFPTREYGDVPRILPRVNSKWKKVLKGKSVWLGLGFRYPEQNLTWGPEEDLWTSESEVVLKGLEVFEEGRLVQFEWKKLMSKFLPQFGRNFGYFYVPEPGAEANEVDDDEEDYDDDY